MTETRQERSERFRRLAVKAAELTASGRPAMVTTNGLVVPTGWGRPVRASLYEMENEK